MRCVLAISTFFEWYGLQPRLFRKGVNIVSDMGGNVLQKLHRRRVASILGLFCDGRVVTNMDVNNNVPLVFHNSHAARWLHRHHDRAEILDQPCPGFCWRSVLNAY